MSKQMKWMLALAVLLAGAAWWFTQRPQVRTAATPRADSAQDADAEAQGRRALDATLSQRTASSQRPGGARPVVASAPLPAPGTPVADIYAALHARAGQGDVAAACRLSDDLSRCATERRNVASVQQITGAMADGSTTSANTEDFMATLLEQNARAAALCAGVTDAMLREAYPLQRQAAVRDPGRYARWLAANPALDRQDFVADLDRWQDYRKFATGYFQAMLQARRLEDLPLLMGVYAPVDQMGMRPPLRLEQPGVFLALYDVAQREGIALPTALREAAEQLRNAPGATPDARFTGAWQGTPPRDARAATMQAMQPSAKGGCAD